MIRTDHFDQITNLLACSFTLLINDLHKLWANEDKTSRVKLGLSPSFLYWKKECFQVTDMTSRLTDSQTEESFGLRVRLVQVMGKVEGVKQDHRLVSPLTQLNCRSKPTSLRVWNWSSHEYLQSQCIQGISKFKNLIILRKN